MKKKAIISKLNIKDYNSMLENILIDKAFSEDTKNLLLSMLYKVENAYEDYKKVKVDVTPKKEFFEHLLRIIELNCDEIEIVRPKIDGKTILEDKTNMTDKQKRKIITYPNEKAILNAIYNLNVEEYIIKSKDSLIRKSLEDLFNTGEIINSTEVIRDFDGWAWNISKIDSNLYIYNIIFQLIIYILGYEAIENKEIEEVFLKTVLNETYKKNVANNIYKLLLQISILLFVEKSKKDKQNLIKLQNELQLQFDEIDNKKVYIQNITNRKKEILKEIKEIDEYINDHLLLRKEYIKQNELLPQNKKIFSLSDFSEIVQQNREALVEERKVCTEKLEPQNYVKDKEEIENKLNFIKELELNNKKSEKKEELLKELLKNSYKALETQINKIETKKEIVDLIYRVRYLKLLRINENRTIYDLDEKEFEKMEKKLLTKACNLKAITIFSQNVSENYKIVKNVLNTNIIDLDKTYIELKSNKNKTVIIIYDENSVEKTMELNNMKELIAKKNKKIKLFL